ncbi:MAG: hypothetical protein Q7S76_01115 [bacterium]|nr:hypothetical protein [bacterium]
MIITICGSMQFHDEMLSYKETLEASGYTVYIPSGAYDITKNEAYKETDEEKVLVKVEHDVIREHFGYIQKSDAILILNFEKNGIPNYIGGNTFLEMGLAFWLGKKVFVLYPIPSMDYRTEMHAMQPIVIDGDLGKIG